MDFNNQVQHAFQFAGVPHLYPYAFPIVAGIGLLLVLLLVLLIFALRPRREAKPKAVIHSNLEDLISLAEKNGQADVAAVLQAFEIAKLTGTTQEFFFVIFTWLDKFIAPKIPQVKVQTDKFKEEYLGAFVKEQPVVTSQFKIKENVD